MGFDFTTIIDRRGKDALAIDGIGSYKYGIEPTLPDEGFDPIPLWVADMNFATSPSITKALMQRIEHPLYGYYAEPDAYYNSIITWHERRHKVTGLTREAIGYENGIHGCICAALEKFTAPGEAVLMHRPYYVGFEGDIRHLGRKLVCSDLIKDTDGIWRMDYADMDRQIKAHNIRFVIHCSPHNPTGRVWEREELENALAVYEANDCLVISDEIWSDITFAGHQHIPTQMISPWAKEHTIGLYAPSKTFNLAGLIGSYHVIYNPELKKQLGYNHYNNQNVLSMHALLGAYTDEGYAWADELCHVLEANCVFGVSYIRAHFPGVEVTMPQGTYMLFIDCTGYCEQKGITLEQLLHRGWKVGVAWQDGRAFGGPCHIRINMASPMSRLEEAFERMRNYIFI